MNRDQYLTEIRENQGVLLFKFTAQWCGPCKRIAPLVEERVIAIAETYKNFKYVEIDVDEAFDVYAYLRSKKLVTAIPTMLVYVKGNQSIFQDEGHIGSDEQGTVDFFNRVTKILSNM